MQLTADISKGLALLFCAYFTGCWKGHRSWNQGVSIACFASWPNGGIPKAKNVCKCISCGMLVCARACAQLSIIYVCMCIYWWRPDKIMRKGKLDLSAVVHIQCKRENAKPAINGAKRKCLSFRCYSVKNETPWRWNIFLYLAFVVNDLGVISHSNSPVKLSIFRQQIMQFTVIMGAELH